jgi:hypothetical protein
MLITNINADNVIKGDFNPTNYFSASALSDHQDIIQYINGNVRADSLKSYILKLATFQNRNTASDTISNTPPQKTGLFRHISNSILTYVVKRDTETYWEFFPVQIPPCMR